MKFADTVAFIECLLLLTLSAGVGLLVGALDVIAGVGAALVTAAVVGFVLVVAYDKGRGTS